MDKPLFFLILYKKAVKGRIKNNLNFLFVIAVIQLPFKEPSLMSS